jgi:hypothetical protein
MEPLVTRPVMVAWEAPPDTVAASVRRAIDDGRYDEAIPDGPFWLAQGTVRDRGLDVRLTTHSHPGVRHVYPTGLELRGELQARGSGTVFTGRAAMLNGRWERPLALLGAIFAAPALLAGDLIGLAAWVAIAAGYGVGYWALLRAYAAGAFAAIPQAEVVLGHLGTPSEPGIP